jgi:hypothetical protein
MNHPELPVRRWVTLSRALTDWQLAEATVLARLTASLRGKDYRSLEDKTVQRKAVRLASELLLCGSLLAIGAGVKPLASEGRPHAAPPGSFAAGQEVMAPAVTRFVGRVVDSVSPDIHGPGDRFVVTITNAGSATSAPTCIVSLTDAAGHALWASSFQGPMIRAGETKRFPGNEPGVGPPRNADMYRVSCT